MFNQVKCDPESWTKVNAVLTHCPEPAVVFNALSILDEVVTKQWRMLDAGTQKEMREYVHMLIFTGGQLDRMSVRKIISVMVSILLQEIPAGTWPSAVDDLFHQSRLADDAGRLNQRYARALFIIVQQLLDVVARPGQRLATAGVPHVDALVTAMSQQLMTLLIAALAPDQPVDPDVTLDALQLVGQLAGRYPEIMAYPQIAGIIAQALRQPHSPDPEADRVVCKAKERAAQAVQVLFDSTRRDGLAAATAGPYLLAAAEAYYGTIAHITAAALGPGVDPTSVPLDKLYESPVIPPEATDLTNTYLGLFCTACQYHRPMCEDDAVPGVRAAYVGLLHELLRFSNMADEVVFKLCAEFWNGLTSDIVRQHAKQQTADPLGGRGALALYDADFGVHKSVLSKLRYHLITRMTKPREVIVVQDDNGDVVREEMVDIEAVAIHATMRETLINVTRLNPQLMAQTFSITLGRLKGKIDHIKAGRQRPEHWGPTTHWDRLNALSWAAGALGMTFNPIMERDFVLSVLNCLLALVQLPSLNRNDKAIVASNIMYVCSKFPRFLVNHWTFLRTVTNKLFEFMAEQHPGIKEMACDTFLTIAERCRNHFLCPHGRDANKKALGRMGETGPSWEPPFIEAELIPRLVPFSPHNIIAQLEITHITVFYRAIGVILDGIPPEHSSIREGYLLRLMDHPQATWDVIRALNNGPVTDETPPPDAQTAIETASQPEIVQGLTGVLRANVAVAEAMRSGYHPQVLRLHWGIINLFRVFSRAISTAVAENGSTAIDFVAIRRMRGFKREALRLLTAFVTSARTPIEKEFVAGLLPFVQSIFVDFVHAPVSEARDPECLALLAATCGCLGQMIQEPLALMMFGDPNPADGMVPATLHMFIHPRVFQGGPHTVTPEMSAAMQAAHTSGTLTSDGWFDMGSNPRLLDFPAALASLIAAVAEHSVNTLTQYSPVEGWGYTCISLLTIAHHGSPAATDIALKAIETLVSRAANLSPTEWGSTAGAPSRREQWFGTHLRPLLRGVLAILTDLQHQGAESACCAALRAIRNAMEYQDIASTFIEPGTPETRGLDGMRNCIGGALVEWYPLQGRDALMAFIGAVGPDSPASMSQGALQTAASDLLVSLRQYERAQ